MLRWEADWAGRSRPLVMAAAITVVALAGAAACAGDGETGGGEPTAPAVTPPTATAQPPDPREVDLRSATVNLPQWPGPLSRDECPEGSHTFRGGEAPAAEDWNYHMTFLEEPIYVDLDGSAGEEIITAIGCGPPGSEASVATLALRPTGDGEVETMAYVQGSASFYATVTSIDVGGGIVALETRQGFGPGQPTQHRTFQWQDGRFVQLTGPTEAPGE